jgi:hypothetical protein
MPLWEELYQKGTSETPSSDPWRAQFRLPDLSTILHTQVSTCLVFSQLTVLICFFLRYSDLLRRHLTRHDMPTAPDPRRGRACDTCHANKTKCDGGTKCTLCVKRGINCTYKHASKSSSGSKSPSEDITADPRTVANGFTSPALIQSLTPGTPQISPNDEIKAGFRRIANHVRSGEIPIGEDTPVPALDKNWIEGNSKEYFGRFHDTWPILHGPSYVTMDTSLLVSVSIAMISCWLRSPDEFEDVALQLHESLMSAFSDWIVSHLA